MKPGVYKDLPNEDYHSAKAISKSNISLFKECATPAHYVVESAKKKSKDYFDFGTAIHTILLEPEKLDETVTEIPIEVLSKSGTKAGKAWKEWKEAQGDIITLKESEMNKIYKIREQVFKNPENKQAAELLTGGEPEVSYFHQSNTYNYPLKCRPDYVNGDIIIDVKTSEDASPDIFGKQSANLHYHWSAYFTLKIMSIIEGKTFDDYRFLVVEKDEPFGVMVYNINSKILKLAEIELERALAQLVSCYQLDYWPGYGCKPSLLKLPYWAWKEYELHIRGND